MPSVVGALVGRAFPVGQVSVVPAPVAVAVAGMAAVDQVPANSSVGSVSTWAVAAEEEARDPVVARSQPRATAAPIRHRAVLVR